MIFFLTVGGYLLAFYAVRFAFHEGRRLQRMRKHLSEGNQILAEMKAQEQLLTNNPEQMEAYERRWVEWKARREEATR